MKILKFIAIGYALILLVYNLLGFLIKERYLPLNRLVDTHKIDIEELQDKKILDIELISRIHGVYILTEEGNFYLYNLRNNKIVEHTNLDISKDFKDMRCKELECGIAFENQLSRFAILKYGNLVKRPTLHLLMTTKTPIEKIIFYDSYSNKPGIAIVKDKSGKIYFNNIDKKYGEEFLEHTSKICNSEDFTIKDSNFDELIKCRSFLQTTIIDGNINFKSVNNFFIKDIVIDTFDKESANNVIYIDNNDYLYQAKIYFSPFIKITEFLRFFVYLPLLPFMGRQ